VLQQRNSDRSRLHRSAQYRFSEKLLELGAVPIDALGPNCVATGQTIHRTGPVTSLAPRNRWGYFKARIETEAWAVNPFTAVAIPLMLCVP
jgi:hypothetical protein